MPIYEYICNKCAGKFEFFVRNKEQEISCPYCNAKETKKIPSIFSFANRDSEATAQGSPSKCSGCQSHNCANCD